MKAKEALKITKANTEKREIDYLVDKSLKRIFAKIQEAAEEGFDYVNSIFTEDEIHYDGFLVKELEKLGYQAIWDVEKSNYDLYWGNK